MVKIFKNQYGFVTDVVVSRYDLAMVDDVNDNVSAEDKADGTTYYISLTQLDETALTGGKIYNNDDIGGYTDELHTEGNVIAVALSLQAGKDNDILDSYALTTQANANATKVAAYVIFADNNDEISGNASNDDVVYLSATPTVKVDGG